MSEVWDLLIASITPNTFPEPSSFDGRTANMVGPVYSLVTEGPRVKVVATEEMLSRGFFRLVNIKFTYRKFDGSDSGVVERIVFERGDSVGMLLHDVPKDEIILVEQVRIPTLSTTGGTLLELPAGVIDGDDSAEATAEREITEETGAHPAKLERIAAFYLSPGASSERLHLFYAPYPDGLEVHEHAGLAKEDEDIRVWRIPFTEAVAMIKDGRIADAKTIVGLLWLAARQPYVASLLRF